MPTDPTETTTAEATSQTAQAGLSTLLGEPTAEDGQPASEAQKPDAQNTGEGGDLKKEGQPATESAQADPGALVPEKPEGYQLAMPEGTTVDEALLGSFKSLAHEKGLNQSQAQALSDMYVKHMQDGVQRQQEAMRAWEKENRGQIEARADFPVAKADAQRFLTQYGTPDLIKVLNDTLIGSHPALFDAFAKAGKALGETTFKNGEGSTAEIPLRDRLWPDMK